MYSLQFTDGTLFKRQFFYCRSKARIQFTSWAKAFKVPVSRDRVSPGDSISIQNLPPEDLFRNRFAPRRLYSKTKSPGGRNYFIPPRNKLSPGGEFISTRVRLWSHCIYSKPINFILAYSSLSELCSIFIKK